MNADDRVAAALADPDPGAVVTAGIELYDEAAYDAAAACFEHAVDLGARWALINLGNALKAAGHAPAAIGAYEQAADEGDNDAWANLGDILETEGDLAGALAAYRAGSDAGDPQASLQGAFMLMQIDESEDAEIMAAAAITQGSAEAVGMLAHWRWERTLDPGLEADLRAGAEPYPPARVSLADLLVTTGRPEEAATVLRAGSQNGEAACFLPLGNLYCDYLDDDDQAEATYRAGIEAGDTHCFNNLAVLLIEQGRSQEARKFWQLGSDAGDALATRALLDLDDD